MAAHPHCHGAPGVGVTRSNRDGPSDRSATPAQRLSLPLILGTAVWSGGTVYALAAGLLLDQAQHRLVHFQ